MNHFRGENLILSKLLIKLIASPRGIVATNKYIYIDQVTYQKLYSPCVQLILSLINVTTLVYIKK